MKKITFSFCIIILTLLLFPQNSKSQTEYQLDSIQIFTWDLTQSPNAWLMQNREHYAYDNGGTEYTNYTRLNKDNTTPMTWLNSTQQIRTFNAQDKLDTDEFMYWDGFDWIKSSRSVSTYDGSGNNDVITYYNHNGTNWFLTGQDLMMYNGSNLVTETTSRFWNEGLTTFENIGQVRYTYVGDLLMQQDNYNWNLTSMPPDWDTTAFFRLLFNYDGILVDDYTSQTNDGMGSGWVNSAFIDNTYNGSNLDVVTIQNWDIIDNEWEDSTQQIYFYNGNDLPVDIIGYSSTGPDLWAFQNRIRVYWSEAIFDISTERLNEGKAYPNPFKNELNILLKSSLETEGFLQIIDIQGKLISKTELNRGVKSIKINNPYLSKGLYFIHVTSDVGKSIFKVIKE